MGPLCTWCGQRLVAGNPVARSLVCHGSTFHWAWWHAACGSRYVPPVPEEFDHGRLRINVTYELEEE